MSVNVWLRFVPKKFIGLAQLKAHSLFMESIVTIKSMAWKFMFMQINQSGCQCALYSGLFLLLQF